MIVRGSVLMVTLASLENLVPFAKGSPNERPLATLKNLSTANGLKLTVLT